MVLTVNPDSMTVHSLIVDGLNNPNQLLTVPGEVYLRDGHLYVGSGGGNGFGMDGILRFNATTGGFIDNFFPLNSPAGERSDFVFGDDGSCYVATAAGIARRSPDGVITSEFIALAHEFSYPRGLAFDIGDDGALYIGSIATNRIDRYDSHSGALLGTFINDDRLDYPGVVRFAPDGTLFVSSARDHTLLQYSADGEFLRTFAESINVTHISFGEVPEPASPLFIGVGVFVLRPRNRRSHT